MRSGRQPTDSELPGPGSQHPALVKIIFVGQWLEKQEKGVENFHPERLEKEPEWRKRGRGRYGWRRPESQRGRLEPTGAAAPG